MEQRFARYSVVAGFSGVFLQQGFVQPGGHCFLPSFMQGLLHLPLQGFLQPALPFAQQGLSQPFGHLAPAMAHGVLHLPAHLADLAHLQWLYLNGTEVTDRGLANLKRLDSLTLLHLADTQITDAGLEHLAALTNLRILHLSGTPVTDDGIEKLKRALPASLRIYR